MRRSTIAAFLIAATACGPEPAPGEADDRAALRVAHEREMEGLRTGNLDMVLAAFTKDAVIMGPNQPSLEGRAAIRERYARILAASEIELETKVEELVVAGDWAIEHFTYANRVTPKDGGAVVSDRGKGLHVYRRQGDGSWKIARDVFNSDLAPR